MGANNDEIDLLKGNGEKFKLERIRTKLKLELGFYL